MKKNTDQKRSLTAEYVDLRDKHEKSMFLNISEENVKESFIFDAYYVHQLHLDSIKRMFETYHINADVETTSNYFFDMCLAQTSLVLLCFSNREQKDSFYKNTYASLNIEDTYFDTFMDYVYELGLKYFNPSKYVNLYEIATSMTSVCLATIRELIAQSRQGLICTAFGEYYLNSSENIEIVEFRLNIFPSRTDIRCDITFLVN